MSQESTQTSSVPNASESLGTGRNSAEHFGAVRNDSEPLGTVPNASESFRHVPHLAERTENHILTTREAARAFEAAGVSRTERSIVKWCQPHGNAPARLDAYFDPNERRYFITPESVERAIKEEQAKAHRPNRDSEPFRTAPHQAEPPRREDNQANTDDSRRVKELEREVLDLKITSQVKGQVIEQMQQERERLIDQLVEKSRVVGQLETKVLQLEGPKPRSESIRLRVNSSGESERDAEGDAEARQ